MLDQGRLEKLEQTVAELGAETHRLRSEVELYMESNKNLAKKLHILKKVLDERGVILSEDLEVAYDLSDERDEFIPEEVKKRAFNLKKTLQ